LEDIADTLTINLLPVPVKRLFSLNSLILRQFAFLLILFSACNSNREYDLSYTWSEIKVSSDIEGSEKIESIISPYRARLDSTMNEVIGYALHDLTTKGQYESTLGTFVTQLTLTQSISSYQRDVDVAIMNHQGGLRAPINEGPITLGEIFQVMPFENDVVLLEIQGDLLLEVIKYIGQSGRSMIWPVSFEVDESGLRNILLDGNKIDEDKLYTLSASDYLANGGSGFHMLKSLKRLDIDVVKLRDMIVQEVKRRTAEGDSIKVEIPNNVTVLAI